MSSISCLSAMLGCYADKIEIKIKNKFTENLQFK